MSRQEHTKVQARKGQCDKGDACSFNPRSKQEDKKKRKRRNPSSSRTRRPRRNSKGEGKGKGPDTSRRYKPHTKTAYTHDAEFTAKVIKERDRVLAEKEQHHEETRKAFERAKVADKEAMRRKSAELEAVRQHMKQAHAENKSLTVDQDDLLKEQVRQEEVRQTESKLVELQKQIAEASLGVNQKETRH